MATIKGKLQVEISDDYLEADLFFTPSEHGKSWNINLVKDFIDQGGISYGLDDQAISKAFDEYLSGKTGNSVVIAHGKKPTMPSSSILDTHQNTVPDRIKPAMEKFLATAPPPVIVSKEKIVRKGKFKKEEVFEKSHQVKVDSKVHYQGYFNKNDEVGIIIPPSPGKPGKSVQNHHISQGTPKGDQEFHLGANLYLKNKSHVIAETSGFFRQGNNWAEIIAFNDHILELSLSKDFSNCIMSLKPGMKDLDPPSHQLVFKKADQLGYSKENILSPQNLDKLIKQIIASGKEARISISKAQDGIVEIKTNPNETEAELYLRKGMSKGKKLLLNDISSTLNTCGLKGMDFSELKKEIFRFFHSPENEITIPLCEGKEPQRGNDRTINFNVDFQEDWFLKSLKEHLEEFPQRIGHYRSLKDFSMEQVTSVALVKEGDRIFSLGAVSKGKEGLDVYGKPIPGIKGNDPEIRLFEGLNFQEGLAIASTSGILEIFRDDEENVLYGRIRKHRDAHISVYISENKMKANIGVDLPIGSGLYATEERILDALDEAEVYKGIIKSQIDEAVQKSKDGEVLADFLVAEGKFPADKESDLKLFIDLSHGKNNSAPIKKGEKIGMILNKEKGTNTGYDIYGDKLESTTGKDLEIGNNIENQEQDEKNLLVATASGQLFFDGNSLFIKDTLTIEGDLSSTMGRITFPGHVHINGSVQSQSVIRAGENILVKNVVESALLTAEGYIKIGRGVKGNKKAALMSHKYIQLNYAEETNLMATEDLLVEKALLHCIVKSNGKLKSSSKAKIIGGTLKLREGMITGNIGTQRGSKTHISFGQDYLVEDQILMVDRDIKKIQQQMLKVDGIIEKIQSKGGKNEVLLEAREKKKKALKMLEKKNLKNFLLKEKFEMHFESEIIIHGTVESGTIFESHGRTLEISEPISGIIVFFDQNNGKVSHKKLT